MTSTSAFEVGDPEVFSVVCDLNEESGDRWMFGKFAYRIAGSIVGNYDDGTSLRDVMHLLVPVVKDCGNRRGNEFLSLAASEAFRRIFDAMYGEGLSPYDQCAIEETWARFVLTPNMDVFDGWLVTMFDGDRDSRLLWNRLGSEFSKQPVREVWVPTGLVDHAITEAYERLRVVHDSV